MYVNLGISLAAATRANLGDGMMQKLLCQALLQLAGVEPRRVSVQRAHPGVGACSCFSGTTAGCSCFSGTSAVRASHGKFK